MMGDRDFRTIIQSALGSIGKELQLDIEPKNHQTMLFSATLPNNILKISEKYLKNALKNQKKIEKISENEALIEAAKNNSSDDQK